MIAGRRQCLSAGEMKKIKMEKLHKKKQF